MFRILTADQAAALIPDGATIGVNAFLSLGNPAELQQAIGRRYEATGHPNNLEMFCSSGFGGWDERLCADPYIAAGAVRSIVASHLSSMPAAMRMIAQNKIEAYNLPLGVLSHLQRAAAGRQPGLFTRVGLNLFVDPRLEGPGLNDRSKEEWVRLVELDGQEMLFYKAPKIDVALIRGTSADPNGNITFDKECVTVDALALAQAAKANGGQVIVQVESLRSDFTRPRNVIVPGVLVDAVVVCPDQKQVAPVGGYNPSLSGDIHVPPAHMDYWVKQLTLPGKRGGSQNPAHQVIGARAARELRPGDVVNIGIGIPETVGPAAARLGLLNSLTLTVESGGIGGFANITQSTGRIVFCVSFTAGGLSVAVEDGRLRILREGEVRKFVPQVRSVSFSAKNAHQSGQRVLYVTERCVFQLGERGLVLTEVAPGVDPQTQILDLLGFPVEVSPELKPMELGF